MLPEPVTDELYKIALTFVKDIGPIRAKALLKHFGSAEAIFNASLKELKLIAGLGEIRARAFRDDQVMKKARLELEYVNENGISVLWYEDNIYPERLKSCVDAPVLLYYQGNANLNTARTIAVIGTRKYTDYGVQLCEELLADIKDLKDVLVVSGLAHGIDTVAHKNSLKNNLPTVGVLGHGLDRIYPATNRMLAKEMQESGGILTEFPSGTLPDRENFPMRNRIVAGMCDVTVVVESDVKGGALITARIANSYNREVAAFPGRVKDAKSSGCNQLIKNNIAAIITCADDLLELMNWENKGRQKNMQRQLFIQLSADEQKLVDILQSKDALHADELFHLSGMNSSQLAAILLQLEMQGVVRALPGKMYRLG